MYSVKEFNFRARQAALVDAILEELPKEKGYTQMHSYQHGFDTCLQEVKQKLIEVRKQL